MPSEPDISVFRPDRPGIRKVLGDLEAEIMELIWARPGDQKTTVRDIFEILYERRKAAYTTVMSTMTRLVKKNMLRVEKEQEKDLAYVYYPNFTQQEFISRFVERILEDLFVNFAGATQRGVDTLSDSESTQQARQLLNEIAQRRAREEGGM